MKKAFLLFLFVLCLLSFNAHAQKVEFTGKPFVVHTSQKTDVLSEEKKKEYRVSIIENKGKYYWASRENKEMRKTKSGVVTIYQAVDGSGQVVYTTNNAMGLCIGKGFCFNYAEYIRSGIQYIAYFGLGE